MADEKSMDIWKNKPQKSAFDMPILSCTSQDVILEVSASELYEHPENHLDVSVMTASLAELMQSIAEHGIQEPIITRRRKEGGYEIIAGHRRHYCATKLGIPTRKIVIRNYTDDQVYTYLHDLNIKRADDEIKPSQLAKVLKNHNEARKRQGYQGDNNALSRDNEFYKAMQLSRSHCYRVMRINYLTESLVVFADQKSLSLKTCEALSYLQPVFQDQIAELAREDTKYLPTEKQAWDLKKWQEQNELTEEIIGNLLVRKKGISSNQKEGKQKVKKFSSRKIYELLPLEVVEKGIEEEYVMKAIQFYQSESH